MVPTCAWKVWKLGTRWLHLPAERAAHEEELMHALADPAVDLQALERDKIKGAIRTDSCCRRRSSPSRWGGARFGLLQQLRRAGRWWRC